MQSKNAPVKQTLSPKILELQKKIQDENYINSAIDRIALILSRQIVENHIDKNL
ncbi:hypothetical protein [Treponema sp.]|uniref:hypothetical protein n=1 Tax=Treponema sp. TaxID=166 RepID=UPI00298EBDA2|nr:hypothetical protein [Treponema sp.]